VGEVCEETVHNMLRAVVPARILLHLIPECFFFFDFKTSK
jgi:hypothetical protein